MQQISRQRRALLCATALGAILCAGGAPSAMAQTYPAKPVRIIVPFPAGGVTDLIARLLAEKLGATWKQNVIVENRGGASGMIGADLVAKSPPDGLTLLLSSTAEVAINQNLYKNMSYDPARDLLPITLTATTPLIWVTHPKTGLTNFEALTAAKRAGKSVSYASAGSGGVQHMAGALVETKLKMGLAHIPYRGGSPAVADVLAGHVDTSFSSAPLVVQYIRDKRLNGLAVTSTKRMAALPNLPTMNEALGIQDFEVLNWYGLFASKGTPVAILDKINHDVVAVLQMPEVRARITEAGADPVGNSREAFSTFWRAEIGKYADIIAASGAKVD